MSAIALTVTPVNPSVGFICCAAFSAIFDTSPADQHFVREIPKRACKMTLR
jgi:hypothetical protein